MQITPSEATLGAVITDVDLGDALDDATFAAIEAAWYERGVLIFPKQNLENHAHIAFSRRFGSLERSIKNEANSEPEIIMLSNLKADGTLWPHKSEHGLFLAGNRGWHTDSSFKRVPAMASLLAAHQVPDSGGGTEFADMRAAYDALDDAARAQIEDLVCEHSLLNSRGLLGFTELSDQERANFKPARQSLVRRHPVTGRKSIYLSAHAGGIVGWPVPEARIFLRDLTEEATRPENVYRHVWRQYDLVIWDNRQVMHRAKHFDDVNDVRDMRRTTVAGDAQTAEQAA